MQIINNTIHDNQSAPGIWTDLGCSGSVISGNSITGNGGPGILDELDYGATISNNVIENNNNPALPGFLGGGIYVQNSANATISSNTLSGNVGGVYVYQSDRGSGTQGAYVVNNDKVSDNTIQMQAGVNGFTSGISNANVAFTGNNYYLSGSAQLLAAGSNVSVAQWQGGGEDSASTGATFSTAAAIPAPAVPAASATPNSHQPGAGRRRPGARYAGPPHLGRRLERQRPIHRQHQWPDRRRHIHRHRVPCSRCDAGFLPRRELGTRRQIRCRLVHQRCLWRDGVNRSQSVC